MTEQRVLPYHKAVNEALRMEMRRDPTVFVMGEDVAGAAGRQEQGLVDAWGGPYGFTKGLIQEFGPERVRDTPISEAAFIGAAIGAAEAGMRPWVDLMYARFAGVAWDQIANKLAREHFYTNGQAKLPVVIKTFGTCYSPFVHAPGLKCVAPSNAYNAKGLTIAAIRDDNPVVIFDNASLFRNECHVPDEDYTLPIGKAEIVRDGGDVTIVGIGAATRVALAAAEQAATLGIEARVIDLLSLEPLDEETLVQAIKDIGRMIIVDFDHPRCGISRDIVALLVDRAFDFLDGPILTVNPPPVPDPMNRALEELFFPGPEKVLAAMKRLLR